MPLSYRTQAYGQFFEVIQHDTETGKERYSITIFRTEEHARNYATQCMFDKTQFRGYSLHNSIARQ